MEEPQRQPSAHATAAADSDLAVHGDSLAMTKPEPTCSGSPMSSPTSSSSSAQEDTPPPAGTCIDDGSQQARDAIANPPNSQSLLQDDAHLLETPLDGASVHSSAAASSPVPDDNDDTQQQQEDLDHGEGMQQRDELASAAAATAGAATPDDDDRSTASAPDKDLSINDNPSSYPKTAAADNRDNLSMTTSPQAEDMDARCMEEEEEEEEVDNTPQQGVDESLDQMSSAASASEEQVLLQQELQSVDPRRPVEDADPGSAALPRDDSQQQPSSGDESVDQQHAQSSAPREPIPGEESGAADQHDDEATQQHDQHDTLDDCGDCIARQDELTEAAAASAADSSSETGPAPHATTAPVSPSPVSPPSPPPPPPSSRPAHQDGPVPAAQMREPEVPLAVDMRSRHLDTSHESATHDDESEHTVLDTSRRVWEADRQASECRRCGRRFNFLVRRHHCRRCGLVVCDRCSSHRTRLPPNEIIQDPAVDPSHYPLIAMHPQRVCDVCVRLPVKEVPSSSSNTRRRATAPVTMKRSGSSQSLMSECPVCGHDLLGMAKKDQERHLQLCLNAGSPTVSPPRYLVYELSSDSPQISYECPICFEEFQAGEKIARMICLCSYHRHCLTEWLERGKGCPVHYDPTL